MNRRDFLKAGAQTGVGLTALGGLGLITQTKRVFGSNDRVQVAVVGVHGQGFAHMQEYAKMSDVTIVALCDVDENVLRQRLADMERLGLPKPKTYIDYRKLLDDQSVDAVSIATPNHWHSLMGIWACQAGKDAYIEKPCSHNLWEGRQLVRAAAKYNRIVQHGANSRSDPAVIEGMQKMRDDLIGDVYLARGLCFNWRNTIGKTPVEPLPAGVHYDLWTGPAPLKQFMRNRFHYNWHWIWDTGNGDIGNQGIHQVDVARWGLGVRLPTKVSAIGGHFMFDDDQETPNTLNVAYQFDMPDGTRRMMEFEVRHWISNHEALIGDSSFRGGEIPVALGNAATPKKQKGPRRSVGNIFYGSKGYLAIDRHHAYRSWLGEEQEPGPSSEKGGNNYANFIECVRSGKKENLNAPIEEGHLSCVMVHLANASYRLDRTLNFDPRTEQVIGDDEANQLLRGTYREPYVVPDNV